MPHLKQIHSLSSSISEKIYNHFPQPEQTVHKEADRKRQDGQTVVAALFQLCHLPVSRFFFSVTERKQSIKNRGIFMVCDRQAVSEQEAAYTGMPFIHLAEHGDYLQLCRYSFTRRPDWHGYAAKAGTTVCPSVSSAGTTAATCLFLDSQERTAALTMSPISLSSFFW